MDRLARLLWPIRTGLLPRRSAGFGPDDLLYL
jgi:hypothetical protein